MISYSAALTKISFIFNETWQNLHVLFSLFHQHNFGLVNMGGNKFDIRINVKLTFYELGGLDFELSELIGWSCKDMYNFAICVTQQLGLAKCMQPLRRNVVAWYWAGSPCKCFL